MAQPRQDPNNKAQVETENASLLSRARAGKRVIKGSAAGADNYQAVTTAKASMATIDVRQVEQRAQRRTLRVAVLAFAFAFAVAGASELATHGSSHSTHSTPTFLKRALGARDPASSLVSSPSRG